MTKPREDADAKPADGDAPDKTGKAGTAGEEGRDAQGKSDVEKLNMEWKGKAETLNALFAKYGVSSLDELNEKLDQSPADPPDDDDEVIDDDKIGEQVDAWAKKGDPVANYVKKLEAKVDRLTNGVTDAFSARDIDDKKLRERVIAHYNKNRGRFKNFGEAYSEVERVDLRKANAALAAELANLKKEPDPAVTRAPKTLGREITAQEIGQIKKMTVAEYDAKLEQLRSEGRHRDAMALQKRYRLDEIEVSG